MPSIMNWDGCTHAGKWDNVCWRWSLKCMNCGSEMICTLFLEKHLGWSGWLQVCATARFWCLTLVVPRQLQSGTQPLTSRRGMLLNLDNLCQTKRLSCCCNDTLRLIEATKTHRTPQIQILVSYHFQNGGMLRSFIPKLKKDVYMVAAGNNKFQCGRHHRYKRTSHSKEEEEFLRRCDILFLVLQLGCHCLANTANFECGAFSARYTQRILSNGIILVHLYRHIMSTILYIDFLFWFKAHNLLWFLIFIMTLRTTLR